MKPDRTLQDTADRVMDWCCRYLYGVQSHVHDRTLLRREAFGFPRHVILQLGVREKHTCNLLTKFYGKYEYYVLLHMDNTCTFGF